MWRCGFNRRSDEVLCTAVTTRPLRRARPAAPRGRRRTSAPTGQGPLGGGSTRSITVAAVAFSPGSRATLVVMAAPTASEVGQRLRDSYALDLLWGETMGLPPGDTKEGPLRQVISVLEAAHTAYALIGGVALQLHSEEPRATLDIDLAVPTFLSRR